MSWSESWECPQAKELAEFCRDKLGISVSISETGEKWGGDYYSDPSPLHEVKFIMEDRIVTMREAAGERTFYEEGDGAYNHLVTSIEIEYK